MRKINKITIHCSDSSFGDVSTIRKWHLAKGWLDIGYHYIILNGRITKTITNSCLDGAINTGRSIELKPASVYKHNDNQVAICLIGSPKTLFTVKQINSLIDLVYRLSKQYGIEAKDIQGHREISPNKECPCFNVSIIRQLIHKVLK